MYIVTAAWLAQLVERQTAVQCKEPTRLLQRVGHEVPSVVVWPLLLSDGWGGKCPEILATIKLLYNPRVKMYSLHCATGL